MLCGKIDTAKFIGKSYT